MATVQRSGEKLDPRIFRTRRMLQQALQMLLDQKDFDEITVQDITEKASVNRATFYDHYLDRFELLESMVGSDFNELLAERKVQFDERCTSALKAIVLAVCDYVVRIQRPHCRRQLQPHMEAAIIRTVRGTLLKGLKRHASSGLISPEITAATASWAIYGGVKEWVQTPDRCSQEELTEMVTQLVFPIIQRAPGSGADACFWPEN